MPRAREGGAPHRQEPHTIRTPREEEEQEEPREGEGGGEKHEDGVGRGIPREREKIRVEMGWNGLKWADWFLVMV